MKGEIALIRPIRIKLQIQNIRGSSIDCPIRQKRFHPHLNSLSLSTLQSSPQSLRSPNVVVTFTSGPTAISIQL